MRRISLLMFFSLCLPLLHAGYENGGVISSYVEYVEIFSGLLQVVDAGGATVIEVNNSAHVEIVSTSSLDWVGGIWDIVLFDNSYLDYYGGETDEIMIRENASAILKGGNINYIKSMQFTETTGANPHIELYCKLDSWSWINDNPLLGIQGLWLDGTPFHIEFINHNDFDPVYTNLHIIPEPVTLVLLGFGGLLLRRHQ